MPDGWWSSVKLTDKDKDQLWKVYWDVTGAGFQLSYYVNLGFTSSKVYGGGERENLDDKPTAYWKDLHWIDQPAAGWQPWSDLRLAVNGNADPRWIPAGSTFYYCKKLSDTSFRVSTDTSQSCPT